MPPLLRATIAFAIATYLARKGLKKKSLDRSGAIAAFFVGFVSFLISYRFGVTLILFYQSSSSLTKYRGDLKKKIEADYLEGGQRNYIQVLSCSLLATGLAIGYFFIEGEDASVDWFEHPIGSFLLCSYLGHYACCNGDTWASELGVLDPNPPRLVTAPWRRVPAGTNGGMSLYGTLASLFGGLFIGFGYSLLGLLFCNDHKFQNGFIIIGAIGGLGGSFIDSILGATLQATYYNSDRRLIITPTSSSNIEQISMDKLNVIKVCGLDILNGEQVNVLSVIFTTFACGWLGQYLF